MRSDRSPQLRTLGLVLAGGLARRMGGGDKALIAIGGVAILDRVLGLLRPACAEIILNANGDPARFADADARLVAAAHATRQSASQHDAEGLS